MSFLIENLIESSTLRSLAPIGQSTFDNDDLVQIATDELLLEMVGDIMSERQDFFLDTETVTIKASVANYPVPARAVGNAVKEVCYIDTAGSESAPLIQIDSSRRTEFTSDSGTPSAFYFQGDEVVICPTPLTASGSIKFSFFAGPNALIATASCAKITAISTVSGTTTLTLDTDLTASLSVGSEIDFLCAKSPFLLWAREVVITAISSTQIQVLATNISDAGGNVEPLVNDYICPTGFSNIPMIPKEFHAVLAQKVANRMLASLGDITKLQYHEAKAERMMKKALGLIKNRAEISPQKAILRNGLLSAFGR